MKTKGLWLRRLQRASNHLFGVAEAVDGRGIDPVDAEVEGAMDGGDRFVVVLRSPGEFPIAAADGPGAEADRGELEVGVAESLEHLCCGSCSHNTPFDDRGGERSQSIERLELARRIRIRDGQPAI